MFMLYILFNFLTPCIGVIDTSAQEILSDLPLSQSWHDFYFYWAPILRDAFGYFSAASFFSLLIYVVVNSARREPEEDLLD